MGQFVTRPGLGRAHRTRTLSLVLKMPPAPATGGLVVALFLVAGCGSDVDPQPSGAACTQNLTAELPPGLDGTLSLSPDVVAPGDRFTASYPVRRERADTLFLSTEGSGGCERRFMLYPPGRWQEWSDAETITAFSDLAERRSVRAVVPPVAGPGVYEVCDGEGSACALLTVHE